MASTARDPHAAAAGANTQRRTKPTSGATRERLLAAARESFATLGFASTRIADIVALAGTSHGTFYTYFDDKRDALLALTQQAAGAIYGAAVAPLAGIERQSPHETIRARLTIFCRTYGEWWDVVRTWNHASAIHPEIDELRGRIRTSIVQQLCQLLAHDPELRPADGTLDLEIAVIALSAMIEEFASRWFELGRTLGPTEIEQLTALCAGALYARTAPGPRGQDAAS